MIGINKNIIYSVTRLQVEFSDVIGNQKTLEGTGFWIRRDPATFLVTNKHLVDPSFFQPPLHTLRLRTIRVELRRYSAGVLYADTKFVQLLNIETALRMSSTSDCAVLVNPDFGVDLGEYQILFKLPHTDIADESFLKEKVQVMDFASFIGFPCDSGSKWYDTKFNFPIARLCTLSSIPEISFSNPAIKTNDVVLVTGFSFSGSSGSPVILHQKGIRVGESLEDPNFVPPKIIGIMSGHRNYTAPDDSMLIHSGISYFTRSSSIHDLINLP